MPIAAIIYNPTKINNLAQVKDIVVRHFKEENWQDPVWLESDEDDSGYKATQRAMEINPDLICAVGGDGTVRAIGSALRKSQIPMAILPVGTGNLLARNLGIAQNNLKKALTIATKGKDIAIDVACVITNKGDKHYFLVMSGVGLDAAMLNNTASQLKKQIGWLAYVFGGLKSLLLPSFKVKMYAEGSLHYLKRSKMVIVCNCSSLMANIQIAPNAQINDGLLDAVLFSATNFIGWFSTAWNRMLYPSRPHKLVKQMTGKHLNIILNRPVLAEVDGELIGKVTRLSFSVAKKILIVRVPSK